MRERDKEWLRVLGCGYVDYASASPSSRESINLRSSADFWHSSFSSFLAHQTDRIDPAAA